MNEEKTLFELPPAKIKIAEKKFREHNPIWTECKAKLIERYLFYFVQITFHGTYIDAFAGSQEPDKPDMWAAKLVMESSPRWLRNFFLFELNISQVKNLEQLRDGQPPRNKQKKEPKRRIEIYPGDFNQNIAKMLAENPISDTEATFCLLDQRTFECDWASVQTIAAHKKGGKKIELFYFFPEGWINRSIKAKKINKEETLQKWWGNSDWAELLNKQGAVRAQFVCDRFKSEFNYKHVNAFAIYERKDKGGKIMYYMIHASDHDEASVLMNRAYGKALDIKETGKQLEFLKDLPAVIPDSNAKHL
jgi:three-Cys-motif partner protein